MIYLTFITKTNANWGVFGGVRESFSNITFPLLLLAFGSIFVGYLSKEVILLNTITPIVPNFIKITPLGLSSLGMFLAFIAYSSGVILKWGVFRKIQRVLYTFFNSAWQFNYIFNHFFVNYIWKFGHFITYRLIDRGLLEIIGSGGASQLLIRSTQRVSNLQSGTVFNYALIMIVFTSLFILGNNLGF